MIQLSAHVNATSNPSFGRGPLALGLCLLLAASGPVFGQTTTLPDAGSLQRQIEQNQTPTTPRAQRAQPTPPPELKPSGALVVTVQRFEFEGNRLLPQATLEAAVAPWLGRALGFGDLQNAAAAAAQAYRDAGWIVRSYLPQQEVQDGTVRIHIVEAVLGRVQLQPATELRLDPERARAILLAAQPQGEPLNAGAIDRGLLLLQDTPGLNARGHLAAGQAEGETDLVVQLAPRPLWAGEVGIDNAGSRSTGALRLSGTAYANSPLGRGDQATATALLAEGLRYLRGGWTLPLGDHGLRGGLNATVMNYEVVNDELSALDLDGRSTTLGASLRYPLVRSTTRNLYASATLDKKDYRNRSAGNATSDYQVRVAAFTLSGSQFDEWQGGGLTQAALGLSLGKVDLGGSPNQAADAAAARTHGNYSRINLMLGRQQSLRADLSLAAEFSAQFANRNLDSSERFYLGGAQGVRAYPSSEAGGSEGMLLNVELRWRWRDDLTFTAFHDWGRVKVNDDNNFPGAAVDNSLSLRGLGLSAAWATPIGANLKLTWAHRLGRNPNPTAAGKDQDGSLVKNRFWLMAGYPF